MKTRRGKLLLLTGDGYVAPAEKPAFRLPRRPPARATKKQKAAAIALFAPWPEDKKP